MYVRKFTEKLLLSNSIQIQMCAVMFFTILFQVGGDFTAKVLADHIKLFGRISVCGSIAQYNNKVGEYDTGEPTNTHTHTHTHTLIYYPDQC